jgi:hypothetical protein
MEHYILINVVWTLSEINGAIVKKDPVNFTKRLITIYFFGCYNYSLIINLRKNIK